MLCIYFLIHLLTESIAGITVTDEASEKKWCFDMRDKYSIIPGKSFGTLPVKEHSTYLKASCYRFFCKPHELAGKGVFECEPLDQK
ncbi:hypothetical protein EON65_53160 [archaeon]|nr:MAG: hypothetical protein EON65_53160 [archaeon]